MTVARFIHEISDAWMKNSPTGILMRMDFYGDNMSVRGRMVTILFDREGLLQWIHDFQIS